MYKHNNDLGKPTSRVGSIRKSMNEFFIFECNSGSIVFIKNYKYALHVSDALCFHLQEHYKL